MCRIRLDYIRNWVQTLVVLMHLGLILNKKYIRYSTVQTSLQISLKHILIVLTSFTAVSNSVIILCRTALVIQL